jgi:hypothetical protein
MHKELIEFIAINLIHLHSSAVDHLSMVEFEKIKI